MSLTPQAAEIGSRSPRLFYLAATALEASDPLGVLLPEFVLCATLIHLEDPQLLARIPMTPLTVWLHSVDNFNRLAPGLEKEDADDMLWPGMNKYHRATGGAQAPNADMGSKGWIYQSRLTFFSYLPGSCRGCARLETRHRLSIEVLP